LSAPTQSVGINQTGTRSTATLVFTHNETSPRVQTKNFEVAKILIENAKKAGGHMDSYV
jgi:hypothetical protein